MKILRLMALACLFPGAMLATAARANPGFDSWVDRFAADWMRADPTHATYTQYFTGAEQDALDRQLTPNTATARAAMVAHARAGLATLGKFDRAGLTDSQRVSADTLAWQLETVMRGEPFADHDFVFHQFRGLQVALVNFLTQAHPIRNRRDIENYLARLDQVAGQMDEGIAQARERGARGFLPPRFILISTLAQFDRFLGDDPAGNILVSSLDERAARLAEVNAADRAAFVAAAAKTVREAVLPAFRRARGLLESQLTAATDDAGLWRLPRGPEAYAALLRQYTTTDLTADQIHAIGLAEVTRIEARMDGLLRSLGYVDGPIKARMERLEADSQPPAEPDPRPALLAEYERLTRDAERRSALIFDLRPKAPIEVRREPAFTEKSAAPHYSIPAPDGSRPGVFWAPLPGPTYPVITMRTLTYHEAVPGHHFQLALQQELTDLPRFRRDRVFGGISAHSEGWALYAEQLAAEQGWYEGDPKGQLGQLDKELFRARRLVVDTGLHAKRWTRQQAIDYGILAHEVERYVVYPGQACSYKIGMLRILELRTRAQQALGARFDLKQFHNVVLRAGTVPLAVLETVVNGYIAASSPVPVGPAAGL